MERCFSRLKGQRALNNITMRGSMKVKAHSYLSPIAMQAALYLSDVVDFPDEQPRRSQS